MRRRNVKRFQAGEKVIYETKPRLFMHAPSILIKFVIIFLLLSFFRSILAVISNLQTYIMTIVRLPLVTATMYLIILVIFILFLWIIWDLLSWKYTKYMLTNHKVVVQKGVISKNRIYIHYDKIQDIIVSQGLLERLTFSGDIEIFGGHEHTGLILKDIPNPKKVEDKINQMIEGDLDEFKKPHKPKKIKDSVINRHDKKFKRF